MTFAQAIALMTPRIGWKDDGTLTEQGIALSVTNTTSDSGFFFQDQHSAITLQNIYEAQPLARITEANFQNYLEDLKRKVGLKVLADVFEKQTINDKMLERYPGAFDTLMMMQMTIFVSEMILTSIRSNRIQRLGADFVGKLHYDIFREAPNKFAIRGANYQHALGVSTQYGFELQSVRRRFGDTRNMLKTITKGSNYVHPCSETADRFRHFDFWCTE